MKYDITRRTPVIMRRTPHGVRGLKLELAAENIGNDPSHPARGAWIEITVRFSNGEPRWVAPRTGCVD